MSPPVVFAAQATRPFVQQALSDRMQEGCEPLVAIADALGCGARARAALVELLSGERLDNVETMRLRLLRDIRSVFEANPGKRAVFTETLLTKLLQMDEAPWEAYYHRGLEARDLASLLRHYNIRSTTVRAKGDAKPKKGYKRDDFEQTWDRYL